jgi:hypothetical protein
MVAQMGYSEIDTPFSIDTNSPAWNPENLHIAAATLVSGGRSSAEYRISECLRGQCPTNRTIHVHFWPKTNPTPFFPANAILVLRHMRFKDGSIPPEQLAAKNLWYDCLGGDGYRGILPDTPAARSRILSTPSKELYANPTNKRLSATEAVMLCKKMTKLQPKGVDSKNLRLSGLKRLTYGWSMDISLIDNEGNFTGRKWFFLIGDDRQVKKSSFTGSIPDGILVSGHNIKSQAFKKGYDPAEIVNSITGLHIEANAGLPKHLMKEGAERKPTDFDVMRYFDILKHISPPKGYTLDYTYAYAGGNGRPHLYLHTTNDAPFKTHAEYEKAMGGWRKAAESSEKLSSRLCLDNSAESFFEQVVFEMLAGQFYLSWHANYNDIMIVTTKKDLVRIFKKIDAADFGRRLTKKDKDIALKCDLTPRVFRLDNDTAEVSVVMFSKWRGLYRITKQVSITYPHVFTGFSCEQLMTYNCGVMF